MGDLVPAEADGFCQVMDRLISTGGLGVSSLSVPLPEVQLIPSPEPPTSVETGSQTGRRVSCQ